MKRYLMFGLAAAVALCGCGRSGSKEDRAAGTTAASDTSGSPVTLVGCLVPGGAGSAAGAVGTSGNTAAPGFTLIDVTTTDTGTAANPGTVGTPGTGTAGTSGTAGTPATNASVATGTPRSYSLIGKNDDLQKYQNSRVEVRGAVVASTDTGTGVPDVGAASAPAGTPATDVQRVRVDHVKQLDKSCSGPNPNR